MNTSTKTQGIIALLIALLVLSGIIVPATLADEPSDDLEVLRQAAENYFPYESRQYRISADDLYTMLHDGDPATDPLVVSVQTQEQYELGHIPGAINIPWDEITDVAQLQAQIPKDRFTVIYCNHAVHSAQISAILNLLGHNTVDLLYGFEGWTQSEIAISDHFDPNDSSCVCEHVTETEVHTAEPGNPYPNLDVPGETPEEIIAAAANAYLNSGRPGTCTICPCDLEALLIDDDPANDPFVLSLQWPEGYAKGHVPQAVNIPRWDLFQAENLSRLPTDKPVVICCYLGYTSCQVAAILNMMGYDARVALHGLSAWTKDPEITHFRIDDPRNWRDYPIEGKAVDPEYIASLAAPAPSPAAEATPTPPPVVCAQEYIVQANDWLSKLSEKFLGDVMRFPSIAEATNEMHATDDTFARISNPNLIEVGWKLCIP